MCRIPNFMEYILYISDVDLNEMHIYYLFCVQKLVSPFEAHMYFPLLSLMMGGTQF